MDSRPISSSQLHRAISAVVSPVSPLVLASSPRPVQTLNPMSPIAMTSLSPLKMASERKPVSRSAPPPQIDVSFGEEKIDESASRRSSIAVQNPIGMVQPTSSGPRAASAVEVMNPVVQSQAKSSPVLRRKQSVVMRAAQESAAVLQHLEKSSESALAFPIWCRRGTLKKVRSLHACGCARSCSCMHVLVSI